MDQYEKIITDFDNLYRAFRKSKTRRSYHDSAMYFQLNAARECEKLRKELLAHTYKVSGYTSFRVTVPKEREIQACKFRDKVVQHVLCDNLLCPSLTELTILDNYAGQKGKGTRFACDRLQEMMLEYHQEHHDAGYFYKGDIHKYYYSIDHEIAKQIMHEHYPEMKSVWWLIDEFIDSTKGSTGIALGNQINTVVSCLYLDGFDRFVKEELGIRYYGRYADDFVLIHQDKMYLRECEQRIADYLRNIKLELNPKSQISMLKNGIPFLGFHFYIKNGLCIVKLINNKARAYRRKYNRLHRKVKAGELPRAVLDTSLRSYMAHASYCTDQRFRLYYNKKEKELDV